MFDHKRLLLLTKKKTATKMVFNMKAINVETTAEVLEDEMRKNNLKTGEQTSRAGCTISF